MLATMNTSKLSRRERPYRKRGEAQRQILLHIIQHKEQNNGISPTYQDLAEYMDYSHPMCARNVVMGIVSRNRPDRPFLIYINDHYGWQYLEVDDRGHLITPKGKYIPGS